MEGGREGVMSVLCYDVVVVYLIAQHCILSILVTIFIIYSSPNHPCRFLKAPLHLLSSFFLPVSSSPLICFSRSRLVLSRLSISIVCFLHQLSSSPLSLSLTLLSPLSPLLSLLSSPLLLSGCGGEGVSLLVSS